MAAVHPLALRGRASERATLDRLLEHAREGRSDVLILRGEAGVGKTALLAYAREQATGFRLAQIAGVESEMELPFAGLHQLCAPMLTRVEHLPAPQRGALRVAFGISSGAAPERFLVALASLSLMADAADGNPLLCLIDDVQWLDDASRQVLGFVVRRLCAERVGMVFAVREPNERDDFAGVPQLRVEGLPEDEARGLLEASIPGRIDERVRDRIVAETRGNPLALLELPRGLSAGQLAGGFALPDVSDVPRQVEDYYRRRIAALPEKTQMLILLAAADAVGDATLLWRAARVLGIERHASEPAARERVLEIGTRARFRHPLVRSAVYRAASPDQRRAAHAALAAATDPGSDPDRHAWHLAHAAAPPDEEVAQQLLDSASRAESRGGVAAAAAFLDRAVTFTEDPSGRAARGVAAAQAKFAAADYLGAESLLAAAAAGPLDALGRARVERLRAQMAFDRRRGSDAPSLLLHAARQLEPLDEELARQTYLQALVAVIYAGRLAHEGDLVQLASVARVAPQNTTPVPAQQQLLRALASRLNDGYVVAAPALGSALRAYMSEARGLDWWWMASVLVAMDLWDDAAWFELSSGATALARATGTVIMLPYALDYLAAFHVAAGDLSLASALQAEAESLQIGVRAGTLPYVPLRLAAWRGEESAAITLASVMMRDAPARGEGCAITSAEYGKAILFNGLSRFGEALAAAQNATEGDEIGTSSWALYELAEAASRSGQVELAHDAADQLSHRAAASGSAWARGTSASSRALVTDGSAGEELHREAIECLRQTRMVAYLARARLTYGEWLRREKRRADAREQLGLAHRAFVAMGANGFVERARRELLATGAKVRKRRDESRDDLTPQEVQIASLASDGLSNSEIGARLFLSHRTVEWHLRNVFTKLGISSRASLSRALPAQARPANEP
jgi:DNA-binding CsgD family transcriptional regulator